MSRPPTIHLGHRSGHCHPARARARTHARGFHRFKSGSGRLGHRTWRVRRERL